MSREIKFRAWMSSEKRMIMWDEMVCDYELQYIFLNQLSDVSPVMQFTGLRDRNGKEIYEGDVVKYSEHEGYSLKSFTAEVRFVESEAYFGYVKIEEDPNDWPDPFLHPFNEHDELHSDFLPYVTVIGNIHETPELIDRKEGK